MITEFLRAHQLNIMLIMTGTCGVLALFVFFTTSLSKMRKHALLCIEVAATFLLVFDRFAYIFRGDASTLGWLMVRICNFSVFALSLFLFYAFNLYLIDLFTNEGGLSAVPKRLRLVKWIVLAGEAVIVVSQFTGFYYVFDEANRYQRAGGHLISYLFPLLVYALQLSLIIQYRRRIRRMVLVPIFLFELLPIAATVAQIFAYGLSLTNMTLVGAAVILYLFVILDMNKTVEKSNRLEIEFLKTEQQHMEILFSQTAEALVQAIDAKDKYTHGHSARVAEYARKIARLAKKSEAEIREIYFSALLHDVGKIGVPDAIINKEGRLTDEEFQAIKEHPKLGNQILQNIRQSPYISIGAHYHHERYDGRGYPEGLKGEEIPEIARIIAVADTYDAMTSKRSYRSTFPQEVVRDEIEKGIGAQFDPQYAKIMLEMIDEDKDYQMQEWKNTIKRISGVIES